MRSAALRFTLALAATAALPCTALAQVYGGVGVAEVEFKPDRGPSFKPTAISGFVGKEINPNLAAELRLSAGIGSDSNVEVDHVFGAYVRGILPLARDFSLYGLLGVSRAKVNFTGGGGSVTDTGLSYGIGGDINIGKSVAVGVEWASLVRPSGYELNALTLLARFKF
jgi:opacity protein-like surface antigen